MTRRSASMGAVNGVDENAGEEKWLRPSPDLLRMRLFELAGVAVVVAVVVGVLVGLAAEPQWGAIAAVAAVLAGVAVAPVLRRRIRAWGYAERADDLLVRHGLLVARLSVVPYGRMQFIDV